MRIVVAIALCAGCSREASPPTAGSVASLAVTSSSFSAGGPIPARHTCEGEDSAPSLAWSGAPAATKSFVVIVDDPDAPDPAAPKMTWVHWVVYDLPAATTALGDGPAPPGARVGQSDFKAARYNGPCPPIGRHRYFHKVYALDTVLGDLGAATKADVEKAMAGHVVAKGEIVGTYEKTKK